MTWNCRVARRIQKRKTGPDTYYYAIYEVYYDGKGNLSSITVDPVTLGGETIEELKNDFLIKVQAFCKPVLDYDRIPGPEKDAVVEIIPMFQYAVEDNKGMGNKKKE